MSEEGAAATDTVARAANATASTQVESGNGASNKATSNSLLIAPGDLVVLWISRDKDPLPLTMKPGECYTNTFGRFRHNDMIGKPWGSKISSVERRGYLHLLRPSPTLWTLSLPHRTQILYQPDMSFIALQLNLGPGARVIEAGTGSGSFTHTLACIVGRADQWGGAPAMLEAKDGKQSPPAPHGRDAVLRDRWNWKGLTDEEFQGRGANRAAAKAAAQAKEAKNATQDKVILDEAQVEELLNAPIPPAHGRVWSFEYHEVRVERAREEFEAHGISPIVTLAQRDVCKRGFGVSHLADALFLDVPAPWDAVPFAPSALRSDITTRICCFSPCIEQVLRTVTALGAAGFSDIATYESLVRGYESVSVSNEDPGASTAAPGTARNSNVAAAASRIREIEAKKEDRREAQQKKSREERERKQLEKQNAQLKRKREEGAEDKGAGAEEEEGAAKSAKARKLENGDEGQLDAGGPADTEMDNEAEDIEPEADNVDAADGESAPSFADDFIAPQARIRPAQRDNPHALNILEPANVYARPLAEMRGHTSYLTFATLLPRAVSDVVAQAAHTGEGAAVGNADDAKTADMGIDARKDQGTQAPTAAQAEEEATA